jgi:predicted dehydrogenase
MWTGPAPMRPYSPQVHPRGWRAFMEYGNGIVGDMCIHMLDTVRWMLDLGMPARVSSSGGVLIDKGRKSNVSDTQTATFDFPALKVVWTHRTWGDPPDPKYTWGLTLYGDKGTLKASVFSWDFVPHGGGPAVHEDVEYELDRFPEDRTEKDLERHVAPAVRGHMKDLLACMASRGRPVADVEEGYMSTAACILANVSMQVGRSITWDHATGRAVGDDEVNRLLRRPYRAPWTHPEVETV